MKFSGGLTGVFDVVIGPSKEQSERNQCIIYLLLLKKRIDQ